MHFCIVAKKITEVRSNTIKNVKYASKWGLKVEFAYLIVKLCSIIKATYFNEGKYAFGQYMT